MLDDASLDSGDRWVDDWQARVEAQVARAKALAAGLSGISGTAQGGDGLVEVTVDSSGALLDLRLEEDVRRHSAGWIAEQVMAAAQAARSDLARQAIEVAQQSGGGDTAEGRAVIKALTARFGAAER